jgi:branched-chain amino acid transport system substrate-binding protein
MKFEGTRGTFTISKKTGVTFNQMMDVPSVTYQITDINQPIGKTTLIEGPGVPLSVGQLTKPAK